MTARRSLTSRGFTLAELMTVVVIVAILAVVAIVAYRALLRSARGTEAIHVVGNIRVQQEKYKQETDNINYLNVSNLLASSGGSAGTYSGSNLGSAYPTTTPGNRKVGWGASCSTCLAQWTLLSVDTDGPVMFGYTTKAYAASASAPTVQIDSGPLGLPGTITQNYYVVTAVGDPDGQGTYCTVASTSFSNQMFVEGSCQ